MNTSNVLNLFSQEMVSICPWRGVPKEKRFTVDVRIPDVRFGEPDEKASGFQTSGFRTSGSLLLYPVFGRCQLPERPITGHKRPVFECPNWFGHSKSGQFCPDFRPYGSKPVPKPVLNRFGTGSEPVCRYNCPNVRNPDVISGFRSSESTKTGTKTGFGTGFEP